MITTLAKLGATQRITILLNYEADTVVATLLFEGKSEAAPDIQPIQISGTVAEVEAHLASADFSASVAKIEGLVTTLAAAEEALKKEADEKAAEKKAAAAKAKETPAAPAKKKDKAEKPKPAEPAEVVTSIADKATAPATPAPALTPAWKNPAAAPAAPVAAPATDEDLADMFKE